MYAWIDLYPSAPQINPRSMSSPNIWLIASIICSFYPQSHISQVLQLQLIYHLSLITRLRAICLSAREKSTLLQVQNKTSLDQSEETLMMKQMRPKARLNRHQKTKEISTPVQTKRAKELQKNYLTQKMRKWYLQRRDLEPKRRLLPLKSPSHQRKPSKFRRRC